MGSLTRNIRGMHCASCEVLVGKELRKIHGVVDVRVNQKEGTARIEYAHRPAEEEIRAAVQRAGYELGEKEVAPFLSRDPKNYKDLFASFIIVLLFYWAARGLGLADISVDSKSENLWVAVVVGLVAGISTCMALIGGLVLGISARHAEMHPEATALQKFRPHLYFNAGRIIGYGVLGGMAGLLGSALKPSARMVAILTIAVGIVMIFLGLKLIEIFPRLRDTSFTLPSGLSKLLGLHKDMKEYSHSGSCMTGALTFFLPCGFTQAMQLWAVSTGSFASGSLIMMLFAAGTAPGLLGIGGLASLLRGRAARFFFMTAGLVVIGFGLFNLSNGWSVLAQTRSPSNPNQSLIPADRDFQVVRIIQDARGYRPNTITVKKGRPVRLVITSTNSFSCAASIIIPSYNIERELRKGENVIEFMPTQAGNVPFSCFMGMYRGTITVTQ